MFKRIIQSVAVYGMLLAVTFTGINQKSEPTVIKETVTVKSQEYASVPTKHIEVRTMMKSMTIGLSDEDIDLIALVTMAEAEGETERGKRLVISTILNRMDSEYFPDTAEDVIYQANAFSSMWNGRSDRCYVTDDNRQLVIEEIQNRTSDDVMYFRAGQYSDYGNPMFVEGDHYFSSYN